MKLCTKCLILQDDDCFYKDKSRSGGLFPQCKTCCKSYRQSEHAKALRRAQTLRYQKTANGKVNSARTRQRYQQSERGRIVYRQAARRRLARLRNVQMDLSVTDLDKVYSRFNHRCFNCGLNTSLEIDHNYPLSKGYGLSLSNAVLLCRACNAAKSDKLPSEFYSIDKLKMLDVILQPT